MFVDLDIYYVLLLMLVVYEKNIGVVDVWLCGGVGGV